MFERFFKKVQRVEDEKMVENWRNQHWIKGFGFDEFYGYPIKIYKREGFDLVKEIKKKKSAIEIAGPTDTGFRFHDFQGPDKQYSKVDLFQEKPAHVSNLYPGTPVFKSNQPGFEGFYGKVDFIADAKNLSVKENSVGVVYCACLGEIAPVGISLIAEAGEEKHIPIQEKMRVREINKLPIHETIERTAKIREEAIKEAWRVLVPGGFLVWKGGTVHDVGFAINLGFTVLQREENDTDGMKVLHLIFMKEAGFSKE